MVNIQEKALIVLPGRPITKKNSQIVFDTGKVNPRNPKKHI